MNDILEKYLYQTGLYDPKRDMSEEILADRELLAQVAELWKSNEKVIRAVIQARLSPIREELVMNATPPEVLVLRQALVEVAAIITDFQRYAAEHNRRLKDEGQPAPQPEQPEVSTENKESSL